MYKHLLWFLLIILIIFRFVTTRPVYKNDDRIRVTGAVLSDPINYPTSQYLKIAGLKAYLPIVPEINYGDQVVMEGVVVDGKLEKPKVIKIQESKNFIVNFRNKIITFYQETMSEPDAGLIAGITLGSKGALTENFWKDVQKVGVAHVVVASGTNVTFYVSFLMGVLTIFMSRKKAIPFAIVGILLYLFMSGFDAPLVRAAIMASTIFIAQEAGRLVSTFRVLLITAGSMLVIKPDWLIDIGFILSFVSVTSLLLFEKRIRQRINFLPEFLKEGLSTSLAAQIGVAPILFVTFGQFNIWSPIINALILWTIPGIMIFGTLGGIIGLIFPILGKLVLYMSYPLTRWFIYVVGVFT